MAEKKEYFSWFLDEIPGLREKGIIQDETAAALQEHYNLKLQALPPPRNIYSLVIGMIGVVMAVAGAILFLNYNWDMFPKFVRIALAAIPLLLGVVTAYFTIAQNKTQVWREASAVLTSAGAATLTAVLSQIYHTGGELHEFIFLISLLSLPLIYIFNSAGLATLYLFFSFFVIGWRITPWWNSLLIALVLPYLLYHLRKNSQFCVWCRYLSGMAAVSLFFGSSVEVYGALPASVLCSIFIVCGMALADSGTGFGKNPWLLPAFAVQTIMLAIGSSAGGMFRCGWDESTEMLWTFGIVNGGVLVGYMLLFFRKRITFSKIAGLLFIVITALPMIYVNGSRWMSGDVMRILYNLYMVIYGIALVCYGVKRKSLLIFNGGAITLVLLTACRFFDSEIGLLYRSLGLMVLGTGFLLANCFFIRFSKGRGADK